MHKYVCTEWDCVERENGRMGERREWKGENVRERKRMRKSGDERREREGMRGKGRKRWDRERTGENWDGA